MISSGFNEAADGSRCTRPVLNERASRSIGLLRRELPFCGRTKREFTLFSWICIVLFLLHTKVIMQVCWALNNGLIDGTLTIGTVVYLLGPWGGRIERERKKTVFIYLSTCGQAQHSVSNRFHLNNSEAVHSGKDKATWYLKLPEDISL